MIEIIICVFFFQFADIMNTALKYYYTFFSFCICAKQMTFAFDPSSTLGISLVLDQYLLCGAGSYTMW